LLRQAKRLLADAPHRDPVRERTDTVERHPPAGPQRFIHAGRVLGFDTDDLDARIQGLGVRRDAADQAAAADGDEDRIDLIAMLLAQDFHCDRALPRDHVHVVERMHEQQVSLARQLRRVLLRLIEILAVQHDLAAKVLYRLDLDVGSRQRHHDHRGYAARAGAKRDTLRVVAGGRANDTALCHGRRELRNFVISAADLERKHRLKVLTLQVHLVRKAAGQARGDFERRLDRHVVDFRLQDSL
jgi:hypothetical protein